MALHGTAWHCMALHGTAWHCMALHGTAWRCWIRPASSRELYLPGVWSQRFSDHRHSTELRTWTSNQGKGTPKQRGRKRHLEDLGCLVLEELLVACFGAWPSKADPTPAESNLPPHSASKPSMIDSRRFMKGAFFALGMAWQGLGPQHSQQEGSGFQAACHK